jgi:endonuclease G
MKRFLATAAILLFTLPALASDCKEMVFNGVFPKTSEPVTILCKKRFVIGYSTARKAPLWVAEALTPTNIQNATGDRVNAFRPDPALPKTDQATLADFVGTGFDRGHMVPFEDLADDLEAASESFFLTNMVPQFSTNNRGIWNALEQRVRKLPSPTRKVIYIVTGPIFDGTPTKLKSGAQVPTRLYKMVLSPNSSESFTVIIPNADGLSTSSMPLYFSTIANLRKANPIVNPLPVKGTFIDRREFK